MDTMPRDPVADSLACAPRMKLPSVMAGWLFHRPC